MKIMDTINENGEYEYRLNSLNYNVTYDYYITAISVDGTSAMDNYYDYTLLHFTTLEVPSDLDEINTISFFSIFKSGESWERQVVGWGLVIVLFIITFTTTTSLMIASIVGVIVFILCTIIGLIPMFYIIVTLILLLVTVLFKAILGGYNA